MSPCVMIAGALVNMPGRMKEIKRDSQGVKWCFHCRKRCEFFFIVTVEVEPSYYGPNCYVQCGECKTSDGDCFPGRERTWDY